mgnify:FL=1
MVAILDADREGFLRSETALIQLMGRAARNINGKIILYADSMTGSISRAVKEAKRRRETQTNFNKKNKLKPMSIKSDIRELIEKEEI